VKGYRVTCAAALVTAVLTCAAALPAFAQGSEEAAGVSLQRGTQWMSLQAGYARGTGDISPNGMGGGGFGYRRFVLDRWSAGGFVHLDLLGKFGAAADISAPVALEIARHSRWGATVFPYLGFGFGAYYRKYYRTGEDLSEFTPGRHVVAGVMTPIHKGGLLGLAVRMASVARLDDNPVFPGADPDRRKLDDYLEELPGTTGGTMPLMYENSESKTQVLWSIKLDYTLTY